MIRVVLDTNIIVSAMLRSGGSPEAVLNLAVNRHVQLFISDPVVAEYGEVLCRPKFRMDPHKVAIALVHIRQASLPVVPTRRVTAASDPDDNIFLECAEAAGAHYVITGNLSDFPSVWGETRIVAARQFLRSSPKVSGVSRRRDQQASCLSRRGCGCRQRPSGNTLPAREARRRTTARST